MLGSLYKHKMFAPKPYFVLEVIYHSRTEYKIFVHEILRKKDAFTASCILECNELEEALEQVGETKYVSLHIRGAVVLHEYFEIEENDREQFDLERHFTFGDINTFILSQYFDETGCSVYFVRKEIGETWINRVLEIKKNVSELYIGINELIPYVQGNHIQESQFNIGQTTLKWDGSQVEKSLVFDEQAPSLKDCLEEPDFDEKSLFAVSTVFAEYYRLNDVQRIYKPLNIENLNTEGYYIHHFIRKTAMFFLPSLLIVLLINFLVFTNYNTEVNTLRTTLSTNEYKWKLYEDLNDKYEANKSMLDRKAKAGLLSYFADQLAYYRPYQIQFTSLNLKPLTEKGLEYNVEQGVVEISGLSKNHSQYQAWLDLLKQTTWVSKIETVVYKRHEKSKSTEFTLKLYTAYE